MKIVNVKHSRCDIYGGRPGPLGNPYAVGSYAEIDGKYVLVRTRDEAINLYDDYFEKKIADVIAACLRVNAAKYCYFCYVRKDKCSCPPFV